ncbi:hypothetical protein [Bergeyella zoohelcum]|uniref:hypothetical protein n=1 Tax=Bergeyella zoohelcum TaxID=1015 RepID=UPI002A90C113|nr:hypothetical protein [Bergeyella zoohelcum]MDY6025000.1 hypothetical protein [Bergeyella zoohelcum]
MININDIIANDYVFSKDGLKWIELNKVIGNLKNKYSNIFDDFKSFDGYAFPSNSYVTRFPDLKKKIKLIQISNVNSEEWIINDTQKFEYLPDTFLKKKKYLLDYPCILISLTGGNNINNDITSFFSGDYQAMLNQRISALTMKEYNVDYFFYFYALTKSIFFKEQWLGKGGVQKNTISTGREKMYLPKISNLNIVKFVSVLIQSIINKEKLIKQRHQTILENIEKELLDNQLPNQFEYSLPTISEIEEVGRLDTGLYSKGFKKKIFKIKNYKFGFSDIYQLGFSLRRGQNLQESNIGKSIYSQKYYKGFYSLVLPTNFSHYGTFNKIEYLGNSNVLKVLQQGEVVFGAEGTFRSVVICEEKEKYITNIHGITLYNENLIKSIFVKCFMDYLTKKGVIDNVKVGGNGGSFAQRYWINIYFPNFPEQKQKEIAKLYHNSEINYPCEEFTLDNFLEKDAIYNEQAGIYELDKTAKQLKDILNKAIENIINDKQVEISFKPQG